MGKTWDKPKFKNLLRDIFLDADVVEGIRNYLAFNSPDLEYLVSNFEDRLDEITQTLI